MPVCKECKWMDVNPVVPTLGECKVVISVDRLPAKIVQVDDDTSKCKHFQPKETKKAS